MNAEGVFNNIHVIYSIYIHLPVITRAAVCSETRKKKTFLGLYRENWVQFMGADAPADPLALWGFKFRKQGFRAASQ